MDKDKVKKLVQLNIELKALGAEKAELTSEIMQEMLDDDATQLRTQFGTFSIANRKSYELPEWYLEQERELKLQKKKAIKESEYSVTPSLTFTPKKILDVERREFEVDVVRSTDEGKKAEPVKKGQAKVH